MKRDINDMTPDDIRKAGIEALVKSLCPLGMAKFIGQFDMGTGHHLGNPAGRDIPLVLDPGDPLFLDPAHNPSPLH